MKLEKWALIAEIVSSVAVVVTLVLLLFEVRENTDIARAARTNETAVAMRPASKFILSSLLPLCSFSF